MAKINVTSGTASAYGQGELQLQNKAPMDSTLRPVTDSANTASPLNLSTSLVQTTSTLKITTNDNPYIDAEDGAGNNRFTVGRDTGSQQVNVDFASNPGGSTTIVGAIRTYVDGVNLSEVMTFREDGNIGINTLTPGAKLDIHSASNVIMQLNRTGAGKSWFQYLQAGTARWNTGYDNTNGNFTIYDAVNAADRMVVTNAGYVGIGTSTPSRKLIVYDTDANVPTIGLRTDGSGTTTNDGFDLQFANNNTFIANRENGFMSFLTNNSEKMLITAAGNVGIGTSTPGFKLDVNGAAAIRAGNQLRLYRTDNATYGSIEYNSPGTGFKFDDVNSDGYTFAQGVNTPLRISATGNVGIGTTTPTTKLMVEGTGSFGTVSNEVRLQNAGTFVSSTLNAHLINSDGTGAYNSGNLLIQPRCSSGAGVTDIIFATSNNTNTPTERFRITANGVTFNGDTAAANALDDYEEGTFTLSVVPATSGTISLSTNSARYTKIGRQVFIQTFITVASVSLPIGTAVLLQGLPFTIGNAVDAGGSSLVVWANANVAYTKTALPGFYLQNTTQIYAPIDASLIEANDEFFVTMTYTV